MYEMGGASGFNRGGDNRTDTISDGQCGVGTIGDSLSVARVGNHRDRHQPQPEDVGAYHAAGAVFPRKPATTFALNSELDLGSFGPALLMLEQRRRWREFSVVGSVRARLEARAVALAHGRLLAVRLRPRLAQVLRW